MLFSSATLSLALLEDVLFLRPQLNAEDEPTEDPSLRGSITLALPSPKRVTRIVLKLVGIFAGRKEETEILSKRIELDLVNEELAAGKHT